MTVTFDSGRRIGFHLKTTPTYIDYGYAVSSHSSRGQTAERVVIHIDTDFGARANRAGEALVNQRLAYVALSCGQYDAQIFTNFHQRQHAARECAEPRVSHRSAIEPPRQQKQQHDDEA